MLGFRLGSLRLFLELILLLQLYGFLGNIFEKHLVLAHDQQKTAAEHRFTENASRSSAASLPAQVRDSFFTVLQISDIHLDYQNVDALDNFKTIVFDAIPFVAPDVVIVTGDITNAKRRRGLGHFSEQRVDEWSQYSEIVQRARVEGIIPAETAWIDLPGNHDMFGVPSRLAGTNRYYGQHCQLYHSLANVSCLQPRFSWFSFHNGSYAVMRVDAVPEPSLHRPLNFFGDLSRLRGDQREDLELGALNQGIEPAFVFVAAHYPSSFINTELDLHSTLGKAAKNRPLVYLSGHLHTLMGLCPRLYSVVPRKRLLDLELADLRYERRFRVIIASSTMGALGFRDFSLRTGTKPERNEVPPWLLVWMRAPVFFADSEISRKPHDYASSELYFVIWFRSRACSSPDFEVTVDGVPVGRASRYCPPSRRFCLYTIGKNLMREVAGRDVRVSLQRINNSPDELLCGPDTVTEILSFLDDAQSIVNVPQEGRASNLCRLILFLNMPHFFRVMTLLIGSAALVVLSAALVLMRKRGLHPEPSYGAVHQHPSQVRHGETLRRMKLCAKQLAISLTLALFWFFLGPWILSNRMTDNFGGIVFLWTVYLPRHGRIGPNADLFWLYGIQAAALMLMLTLNYLLLLWRMEGIIGRPPNKVPILSRRASGLAIAVTSVTALLVHLHNLLSLHGAFGVLASIVSPVGAPFSALSSYALSRLAHLHRLMQRHASLSIGNK